MARKPVRGWNKLFCKECQATYFKMSRDCMSPSSEVCKECGDEMRPTPMPDDCVPVDKQGNLTLGKTEDKFFTLSEFRDITMNTIPFREFKCPECGGCHYGRMCDTVNGKTVATHLCYCHDEFGVRCKWKGIF